MGTAIATTAGWKFVYYVLIAGPVISVCTGAILADAVPGA